MDKITREEESKIPQFNSHDEARQWFKEKYGSEFMMAGSEIIGEEKCYFYYLILDREAFMRGHKEMEEKGYTTGTALLMSYQPIQIMESGSIHIVH